jgi:hypothetical protein
LAQIAYALIVMVFVPVALFQFIADTVQALMALG